MKARTAISPPLLVGLLLGVYATVAFTVAIMRGEASGRWELFYQGASQTGLVLVAAGLLGLARRAVGSARVVLQIAAALVVAEIAWSLVRLALGAWLVDSEYLPTLWEWAWRVSGVAMLVVTILISIATRAWQRNPIAPIVAVLACLGSGWTPYVGQALFELLFERHRTLYDLYWPAREIAWVLAILAMVHSMSSDQLPAQADPRAAGANLRRSIGLVLVRCVAMLAVAGFAATEPVGYAGPILVVAASLGFAWEVLAIDRAAIAGMPRVRLVLGATLVAFWASMHATQTASEYAMRLQDSTFPYESTWSVLGPLLGTLGLVFIGSAIHSFADSRGNRELRGTAALCVILSMMLALTGLAATVMLSVPSEVGLEAGAKLAISIFGIGALLPFGYLFARTARVIDADPSVPIARVDRSRTQSGLKRTCM
ncbi:MAG: hypothetical protein ABI867_33190 [Kofleriaceae bacterium]